MKIVAIKDDTKKIGELNNYSSSPDFIPFEKRLELATARINVAIAKKDKDLLDKLKEYANILIETKLNENYDFNKLNELYQEALKCFKYILVEETIKYNQTR